MKKKHFYQLGVAFAKGAKHARQPVIARDAAKWITVHPHGKKPDAKGSPVLIDSKTGKVLGGMGGKFTGKHISESSKAGRQKAKGMGAAKPKTKPKRKPVESPASTTTPPTPESNSKPKDAGTDKKARRSRLNAENILASVPDEPFDFKNQKHLNDFKNLTPAKKKALKEHAKKVGVEEILAKYPNTRREHLLKSAASEAQREGWKQEVEAQRRELEKDMPAGMVGIRSAKKGFINETMATPLRVSYETEKAWLIEYVGSDSHANRNGGNYNAKQWIPKSQSYVKDGVLVGVAPWILKKKFDGMFKPATKKD